MLTKQDHNELEKKFVTNQKFDNAMKELFEFLSEFKQGMMDEFKTVREEIREVKTELNQFRVEVRYGLANHEKRISRLEETEYSN